MTGRTREKVGAFLGGPSGSGRRGAGSEGPAGGAACPQTGEEKTGRALSPLAFALAHALTLEASGAGFPLPVRLAWASFLRRVEAGPDMLAKGAEEAHLRGLMHAGRLTPEGVRAALFVLSEDLSPPLSIDPQTCGQGGRHGRQ